jgi:hydrogenase-4 component B
MMLSVFLVLLGSGLVASSGFLALPMPSRPLAGQRLSVLVLAAGSLSGLAGAAWAFSLPAAPALSLPWALPFGTFSVSIDGLSAFFLVPVFAIPALGAVYGLGYWKQTEHAEDGRKLGVFYGLLSGSMVMVVIARDAALFLIAWEIMALSAYFAATAEDDKSEVRKAGWIYLVATHIGTLILIAMFGFWRGATGSFALDAAQGLPLQTASIAFVLALLGFGFKAGLMPLHVWLPGAHANAPSHVSAVMSGVMLKMGIYGIVRMSGLLGPGEPWWGIALLAAGAFSAVFGIAFASGQRDMKRLLAYSSIENLGIVAMGIGLALLGRACGRPELVLLGMAGALLHVWNHGLFKSLLFFNAGAVIHATGTRDIELMGGLAKKMPVSAFLFLVGAVAICALPPLNGFAGEWLLYIGFFKTLDPAGGTGLALAGMAAVALAMTGALATVAFVKLYGTAFSGSPRSSAAQRSHDPRWSMRIPMMILAALCGLVGLFPMLVAPLLEKAVRSWAPSGDTPLAIDSLAPQGWISVLGLGLILLVALIALWRRIADRKKKLARGPTWDCGYAAPTARMQYGGTSLSMSIVKMFSFALWPETRFKKQRAPFPEKAEFETKVPDTVLDRLVMPVFGFANRLLPKMHFFQQGQTYLYVLYIAIIAIALFAFGGIGAGLW